ncbi:hypothetical protein [Paraburkholderia sp. J10-1]|uniref:hypothetical protein n=1 Tax=Paraburkholderia sp. J10-1 TaxID=2805430 RepID=UPI002AB6075F|nr:hypothetical protein [Paraburkholderia sp. J10-1]
MPTTVQAEEPHKLRGFLKRLFGNSAPPVISETEQTDALADGASVAMLLGGGKRVARNRIQIYEKWIEMVGDPIISTALRLHVTAALGGHETSGDVVFIETASDASGDKGAQKLAKELTADLGDLFNRIAYTVGFNGAAYGDAYGRVYLGREGVADVYVDELVLPPMVIPYERANTTCGYVVASGTRAIERLSVAQMVRLKMPRCVYIPQVRAMEKAIRTSLREDRLEALPLMPSSVGGSFLEGAEGPYDQLSAALVGLVGQRVLDSIDETMITVNMDGMNKEQQKIFAANIKKMLLGSQRRAQDAVKRGRPVLERIFHMIPVWGDKQLATIAGSASNGSGRGPSGSLTIEDVMFYAKLLAGALGTDLSMLGFSELLSGGLGDGGFFRTSAQAAERSRLLRVGMTDFFNSIIDIHTYHKYGKVYRPDERPWTINFYGTISALETERQRTKTEAMNTAITMAQALDQIKGIGLARRALMMFLTKIMLLDEDQAALIAEDLLAVQDQGGGNGEEDA